MKDIEDQPISFGTDLGQLCPDVIFATVEDDTGTRYWAKQWLNEREPLLGLTREIESFLANLDRSDLCLAVEFQPEFGLLYPFDHQLFSSTAIIHQRDCRRYFDRSERKTIKQFASTTIRWVGLPAVCVGELTDFQVTRTSDGLVFLDFEPNWRYAAEIVGVNTRSAGLAHN